MHRFKTVLILVSALVLNLPRIGQAQIPVIPQVLHTFGLITNDAQFPAGSLTMGQDGALYGTAYSSSNSLSGGAIYKINRDGTGYSALHSFLIAETQDTTSTHYYTLGLKITRESDGVLYGILLNGGANGEGSVFKMNTDGTQYSTIHSFTAADGLPRSIVLGNDGVLYGVGAFAIFKLYIDGSGYTVLHTLNSATEGSIVLDRLLQGNDGELYGAAFTGGPANSGTVFKLDAGGTNFSVICTFSNAAFGTHPAAGVIQGQDGELYGTTTMGGTNGGGSVFKMATDGSGFQCLYNLSTVSTDGIHPYGGLAQGFSRTLYGTAESSIGGTTLNGGTIFAINPDGTGYTTLYTCTNAFGFGPYLGPVLGSFQGDTGILFGANSVGGVNGTGTNVNEGTIWSLIVNPVATITPVVSQSGNAGPVVFWPQWALGYQLQSATNLISPNWTAVTNGVPVTGMQLTNVAGGSSYYRLVYPN